MYPEQADVVTFPRGPAHGETMEVLLAMLENFGARQVLDIGCGDGTVAGTLTCAGLSVTGIDPSADAIAQARQNVPQAIFHHASAEALPAGLPKFDAAFFVNSLHHVDETQMQAAMLNAVAALRPGGIVIIIEPLAQGSFFRAMRPLEDETEIRAKAAAAIEALISDHRVVLRDLRRWNRESRFRRLEEFIDYLSRASPERAGLARRHYSALARAWRDNIHTVDGVAVLTQPMICWTLSAPADEAA
ncbi:MAG: class I SAM-dependent methyltransferase [Paracoccus sp. (in: a-proteobacteria)]|nr:class I SAM-dependent methyltransferase [Paracoccus sp. (in: a-proteobacteria)]